MVAQELTSQFFESWLPIDLWVIASQRTGRVKVLVGHGHIVAMSLESKDDALLDRAVERYLALLQEQLGPVEKVESYLLALKVNVSTIDEACEQTVEI